MLILARKVGEVIYIDGGIAVKVMRIQGSRVAIGIEAPIGTRIQRGELMMRGDDLRESEESK